MKSEHFYYIKDEFYDKFKYDSKLMQNKKNGNKRPCFIALTDPKCDTIRFGEVLGKKSAFLIQNIFPVSKRYIESASLPTSNNVIDSKSKPDVQYSEWYELLTEFKSFISRQNDYGTFLKIVLGDINSLMMCLEDEELRIKNDM